MSNIDFETNVCLKDVFNKQKYLVVSGALTKQKCNSLAQYLFTLKDLGKTNKDPQCPISDSVYGAALFEDLLKDYANPIGKIVGRNLVPTYSYARIYRPGEILEKHTDRESCEISATLTLGYDSKYNWPIFFNEDKEISVMLEPGELAVYKGCEITHWRNPFQGNWHAQVFLHYVDAEGPFKDFAYDKREELNKTDQFSYE